MIQYNNNEKALIYLDYLQVSKGKIEKLLGLGSNIYNTIYNVNDSQVSIILGDKKEILKQNDYEKTIVKICKYLETKNIYTTTIISADYPERLKHIPNPPIVLYYKGDLSIANKQNSIGIVGTRKPSRYGRWVAEEFVSTLSQNGLITISGLAYGIDSEVARNTLEMGGKTIAVLGGGIEKVYPSSNSALADNIIKNGGLVISEYFPTFSPTKYTFPERNRIISGLSRGVLVIEAGIGSGSLITATRAIEQGKDLFVVPGNIDSKESKGSNKLIEEFPTCVVISPDRILREFGIEKTYEKEVYQCSMIEQAVINAVSGEPKSFDELCEILKEDSKNLNLLLTAMEISGIIKKLPGNYYGI